jgi:hypothetical protein
MIVELLAEDIAELPEQASVADSFARGLGALASRPTHGRPRERPHTAAGVAELTHLYAAAAAELRMYRFSYTVRRGEYERSAEEYEGLEAALAAARRELVPQLRARLGELRQEEARLEQALREHGLDPLSIGPHVPQGRALDPTPRPDEGVPQPRSLTPLAPRPPLRERLRKRKWRDAR